jgi:hypothetical protein
VGCHFSFHRKFIDEEVAYNAILIQNFNERAAEADRNVDAHLQSLEQCI